MSYTYEQLVEKIKWLRGLSPEAAQDYLKSLEASAVMAIRVTRSVFGISMGQAKNIIDRHPAWKSEAVMGAQVQESAINVAEKFNLDAGRVPAQVPSGPQRPSPFGIDEIDPHLLEEKDLAVASLVNSPNFASTHAAISKLKHFRHLLSAQDKERLVHAAVGNDQIRWIATDSDVFVFFVSLITEHSFIDENLLDAAIDTFGLRPSHEDPNAD